MRWSGSMWLYHFLYICGLTERQKRRSLYDFIIYYWVINVDEVQLLLAQYPFSSKKVWYWVIQKIIYYLLFPLIPYFRAHNGRSRNNNVSPRNCRWCFLWGCIHFVLVCCSFDTSLQTTRKGKQAACVRQDAYWRSIPKPWKVRIERY